ncbi:hypothetical protein PF004_g19752 [Phytophthora fragariae]|uniref:Uncharacterized protein n=1 Tax=Phytophthora fragariae TaxID=53985 RepID=A0A6G0N841_9STRA|nr:hypothetical protein PF004_g19752 [Phytophthora fragariae]
MKTALLSSLWNDGYKVVQGILSEDEVAIALRAVADLADTKWFRDTSDPKRRQAPWIWPYVDRRPGSTPQHLHRDFSVGETTSAIITQEWVQASVLVALTPGVSLITVPGAFHGAALRSSAHLVELSPGGLLLHRGDLPHADPCVRKVDVRLQGTLLVDDVVHESAVERVAWSFFRCNFCFKRCDSKRALANHERYCDSNPDKESIAKKHKANNDKGAFCEKYKHHFSNKNTFNVHKC